MQTMNVGVIGCGSISGSYLQRSKIFPFLKIIACADLIAEKARSQASAHGIEKTCTVEEMLADKSIDIILNLTVPKAHAGVAMTALQAGKHVYNEKPLALSRAEADKMIALAKKNKLRIGCAPDTFLGAGIQTCRKAIDDGLIGRPIGATAFMLCHGHESWHPSPEFYYEEGGGPMFDMGPYYLTALINLIGPIHRVSGSAGISFPERTITSAPKKGKKIIVETPTHIAGVMDFANGAIGTITTSFDVWGGSNHPRIEIFGTKGSLNLPDPNTFGGKVSLICEGEKEWRELPLIEGFAENTRSLGLADMALAIMNNKPHRASGELAYHVLDTMISLLEASKSGKYINLSSRCSRPEALQNPKAVFQINAC
jgi:predicted dehydrogenase